MAITGTNLTINVRDMDRSIEFYKSIGLSLSSRWGEHYAQLSATGIVIGLHPTAEEHMKGNSGNLSIGFTSDDFEGTRTMLQGLSIVVQERQEEGGRFLHFNDPDGTAIYFIQPKW